MSFLLADQLGFYSILRKPHLSFLSVGITIELLALALLHFAHACDLAFWFCLAAIFLCSIHFYRQRPFAPEQFLSKRDIWVLVGLLALSVPVYIFMSDWLPYQVGGDEVTICDLTRTAPARHLLGSAGFASFPNLGFIIFGAIAQSLGEISISNLRLINGFIGVLIVLNLYIFYRTSWGRLLSSCAALIAGFNHTLIALSRYGYHATIDVLIETMAYTCLLRAFLTKNRWLAFLAGLMGGSAYYFYYPARSIMPIWSIVIVLAVLSWQRNSRLELLKVYGITLLAFFLTALPQLVASLDHPSSYMNQQLLISKEGLHMFMEHAHLTDERTAPIWNMFYQLTCFNTPILDAWGMYPNPDYAFCDSITGVLIWTGLLIALVTKAGSDTERWLRALSLVGFLLLMFAYACIINCAPTSNRIIILIPFLGYLSQTSSEWLSSKVAWLAGHKFGASDLLSKIFMVAVAIAVVSGNLLICRTWLVNGLTRGDRIGKVVRYVQARNKIANYKWYFVTKNAQDSAYDCFIPWCDAAACEHLVHVFTPAEAEVHAMEPKQFCEELETGHLNGVAIRPPFTIFLTRDFCPCRNELLRKYPQAIIRDITDDGMYEAVELLN